MLWRRLAGGGRGVWLCRPSVRVSPAGAAPVPPGPAFPWRVEVPEFWRGGPQRGQICPALPVVSPQGYRDGRSIPCQSLRAPGGALSPAPALRHCLMVGAAGTGAGTALCGVLETLRLCFKFQGHELFPGKKKKMDRLSKKQITPTREGALIGASLWTLAGPPGAGPGGADGRSGPGCRGDPAATKLRLRPLCLPVGRAGARCHQQPLSCCSELLGVTPDSAHPLPALGRFSLLPTAILIRLSPTPGSPRPLPCTAQVDWGTKRCSDCA